MPLKLTSLKLAIAVTAAWVSSGLTKIVFTQEIPHAAQILADGRSATIYD